MTARQYLKQLRKIQLTIERLSEEIERRRAQLESTTVPLRSERIQTSSAGDRFADMIAMLADRDLYYQTMIEFYEELREKIVCQILELDDERYVKILLLRYVDNKTLPEIADEMFYSYGHVRRLHGDALIAFARQHSDVVEM